MNTKSIELNEAESPTTTKLANTCSPVSKQLAIVPQIEKIEQFQFDCPDWKDKAELKSAWDINQRELAKAATAAMNSQADVYICLAKARAILSQRGDKYAKMRDEAGILNPKTGKRLTWTEYFAWFQSEHNFEKCLRVVQFKLAEMAGKKRVTKKSGPSLQLTGSDKRKLVDSALESHNVVEAFRKGGDVDTAVKELQKNLPPKDKLLCLVDDAPRLLKGDNGVQIAKPTGKNKSVSVNGVDWNPLLYVGVTFSASGETATLWEKIGDKWFEYDKIDGSASYQFQVSQEYRGQGYNLGNWYPVYDWTADNGFANFADWVK